MNVLENLAEDAFNDEYFDEQMKELELKRRQSDLEEEIFADGLERPEEEEVYFGRRSECFS